MHLGRKFKKNVDIVFNGLSREFNILDKEYRIERIKGLPRNKVEPSKEELDKIFSDQKKIKESKKVGSKKNYFQKNLFFLQREDCQVYMEVRGFLIRNQENHIMELILPLKKEQKLLHHQLEE